MRKTILIAGGVAVAAAGVTAFGALAERGGDGYGHGRHYGEHGRHHGGRYHRGGDGERGWGHRGEERMGGGWGRGRGPVTREEFDAETRAIFAEWDENGDGIVDRAEAGQRIGERMERRMERRGGGGPGMRMLRRLDEDGDGAVTEAEAEAYVNRMFTRMDLTGDGRITDADLPPMMRGLDIIREGGMPAWAGWREHGRRGGGHGGGMLRQMLGADADKDGEITLEEAQAHAAKRMGRFDRNGDGRIDDADRETLRKEMADYRVLRFFHRFGAKPEDGLTREAFKAHRDERFARRDIDGDDVIERGEMRGGPGHHGRGWGRGGRWSEDRGWGAGEDRGGEDRAPDDAPREPQQ